MILCLNSYNVIRNVGSLQSHHISSHEQNVGVARGFHYLLEIGMNAYPSVSKCSNKLDHLKRFNWFSSFECLHRGNIAGVRLPGTDDDDSTLVSKPCDRADPAQAWESLNSVGVQNRVSGVMESLF